MEWFSNRRKRGPEWKQGWTNHTLSSISLPPLPLLAIFAIVILFLSLSKYLDYRVEMQHTLINFQLLLLLLPVILIFLVRSLSVHGRFVVRFPRAEHGSIYRAGNSPWGVAVVVVLLLVMISYQSSFHSQWFRPLWRSF